MFTSFRPVGASLVDLCMYSQAKGGFVQIGPELVESNLSIADFKVEQMAVDLHTMVGEYRRANRQITELYLGFGNGALLVVFGTKGCVTLRFTDPVSRVESVVAECRNFLKHVLGDLEIAEPVTVVPTEIGKALPVQDPPESGAWRVYEPQLADLLSSVISRNQATVLIQRVIGAMGIEGPVPDEMLEKVTQKVMDKIPDRRKRDAMSSEAEDLIRKAIESQPL